MNWSAMPPVSLCVVLGSLILCLGSEAPGQPASPMPFPDALADASIRVAGLDSPLDDALIIGNGDINALIWSEQGALVLRLTKNDVWDARLDTSNDPPLPTLARIKELGRSGKPIGNVILPEGVEWSGPDSYHAHPHPCPRACARVVIGDLPKGPSWHQIRGEGAENSWERRGQVTVMSIRGREGASNGYACAPLDISTEEHSALTVRLSGTENARYFIDAMAPDGASVLHTGWIESPTESEERTFEVAPQTRVARLILYTWTEDGQLAENRFEAVAFEGPAGKLSVDLNLPTYPTCPAALELSRAVANIAGAPDGPPRADVRALADRNVFLIESAADVRLLPSTSQDTPAATEGKRDGVRWLEQVMPGDLDWQGMKFAVALAESGKRKAIAIVTSRESEDLVRDAVALARRTAREDVSRVVERHERRWQEFWSRSGIEMEDKLLQRTWYRSLYFLRCVSKPGAISPGLFAGLINDTPAWHGDYHTNYNIQQTFWGAYSSNHPELAEPYDRLVREYLPRAKWLARKVFSMEGAFYPHVLFAYEPPDPEACRSRVGRQYIHHTWGMTLGVAGFTVQPLWWHYKYAPDRKLLEETVYPAVREVALFYAEFLEQCDGDDKARFGPTVSPEHWGWRPSLERNYNCAFDIAMARYTLQAAIEGAETLGRDEGLVRRFRKALRRLPDYPLSGDERPVVVDVEGAPPITYNIAVPATPVFPCDVVTWQSRLEERGLFARTIEGLKWNGNNSTVILAVARARLGIEGAQEWLHDEVEARTRPNGTLSLNRLKPHHRFNDFGHYTEQFGVAMAVSELFVQSVGDVIRVLPALPEDSPARFVNLRTQGGFLVSAGGRGGGVQSLRIVSTVGGPLRLLSPWPAIEVRCGDGGEFRALAPNDEGIVAAPTGAGDRLTFRPG